MRPRTWGKILIGLLVIGGTFALLWALYGPRSSGGSDDERAPAAPLLHRTRAVVLLHVSGVSDDRRAVIRCDGVRRSASGFWRHDPAEACDALASTRAALLAGPGCATIPRDRTGLRATGRFGAKRFDHRAQRLGCPHPEAWLDVNALAAPVLPPDREADEPA